MVIESNTKLENHLESIPVRRLVSDIKLLVESQSLIQHQYTRNRDWTMVVDAAQVDGTSSTIIVINNNRRYDLVRTIELMCSPEDHLYYYLKELIDRFKTNTLTVSAKSVEMFLHYEQEHDDPTKGPRSFSQSYDMLTNDMDEVYDKLKMTERNALSDAITNVNNTLCELHQLEDDLLDQSGGLGTYIPSMTFLRYQDVDTSITNQQIVGAVSAAYEEYKEEGVPSVVVYVEQPTDDEKVKLTEVGVLFFRRSRALTWQA